jgi:hypothetical protein
MINMIRGTKTTIAAAAVIALAALVVAGCGGTAHQAATAASTHAQPTATVTETVVAKPKPTVTITRTVQARPSQTTCPDGEPLIQETDGGPWVCDPDGPITPAPAPAVVFTCTVMSGSGTSTGLEARVWGYGPPLYSGEVYVSFSDYAGSGHLFPPTSGYMTSGVAWVPIPAADVGASAEPSQCSATA